MSENVLVTGASSGIGKATAQLFAAKGFRVFGTSRRALPDAGDVVTLQLDVRSSESVERCVAEVVSRAGPVDVLVNNAGVMHRGMAEETSMDEARAVLETNLLGVARMVNAVLPEMRRRGRGRIINVGSLAAWVGEPNEAFYAASKAALARYTEALRYEVRPLGVHVSLIEPGVFRTEVLDAATVGGTTIADYDAVREAAERLLDESLPKGADPAEAAELIAKVAVSRSPRLRYGVGRDATRVPLARVLLPQRVFDRLVRRAFGL